MLLHHTATILPDVPLGGDPAGRALAGCGCQTLADAAAWIHALPYGRPLWGRDLLACLREHRGTCSSRHALLAAAAQRAGVDARLVLVLFEMSEANTPGVGAALAAHGLEAIPEAHCVVELDGVAVDLTFPDARDTSVLPILAREEVDPLALSARKPDWHRQHLEAWCRTTGREPEAVWTAREAAIAALGAGHALGIGCTRALAPICDALASRGLAVSILEPGEALLDRVREATVERGPPQLVLLWHTAPELADLFEAAAFRPRVIAVREPGPRHPWAGRPALRVDEIVASSVTPASVLHALRHGSPRIG